MPILVEVYTKEEIRNLYSTGLSVHRVAEVTKVPQSTVYRIVKDITRTLGEANLIRPRKPNAHWRTCRCRARRTVELSIGRKLLPKEIVHHVDEDFTNNELSNLKVVSAREHAALHPRRRAR